MAQKTIETELRVIINFFSKIGVDAVSRLIGLLTLPFITRQLGTEGYGLYSYLFVIVSYYGFFIDFGYLNFGTNRLCEKDDKNSVIGRILSLQILTAIASYAVIIISGFIFLESEKFLYILLFSAIFLPQIISIKYYYLANNKLYFNSTAELAGQVVFAVLVFTLFAANPDVSTLIIIAVVQAAVTGLVLFIPYIRGNSPAISFNLKKNFQTLKEAYKLGLSSKAEGITSSFIILMTGAFLTEHYVGLYNASYKIYLILLTVIQGFSYAVMPVLLKSAKSDNADKSRLSLIFYSFLLAGLSLGIVAFALSGTVINIIYGADFSESADLLKWFSLTISLWPLNIFIVLLMLAENRQGQMLALSFVAMAASIVFSLTLIPAFGVTGSAAVMPLVAIVSVAAGAYMLHRNSRETGIHLASILSFTNLFSAFRDTVSRVSKQQTV